ncbi:type IV pilin-like G/H family protein [Cronbergia sp. UHCC 0137]|uniref:type IV pilin-like G/H family protein n=1 Tax=Cronbergia sp. UHCC 0137 TaxID=3110239 RepID=UPI002B21892F|nr:type IV pilin-like G/H family protein [Cronbergia sp. UHCC 0137]MEA5616952.1 type IV pilin-like G/H family protein [Cronbergia sp. UHCC 0137]
MKTELKAKFLQYILDKKQPEEGFTLIELMLVILVMSILTAIALPSLVSQAKKAQQAEGKQVVGGMNRAQQLYFFENGAFAPHINNLAISIPEQTNIYQYQVNNTVSDAVGNNGMARLRDLKSYLGSVVNVINSDNDSIAFASFCESETAGIVTTSLPPATTGTGVNFAPTCPSNYESLMK